MARNIYAVTKTIENYRVVDSAYSDRAMADRKVEQIKQRYINPGIEADARVEVWALIEPKAQMEEE